MNPGELISALTWRDALDFGLLFAVAYALLRVVQGTRAAPVLLAVATVGVVAWLVDALDLIAVASLMRYFFEYGIIILIVVFQQELRRLLLYVGQRLLPQGRRRAARSAVGELVVGLERLQRARIGALVLLQGEIDVLEAVSHRGRELDAPLRADTLVAMAIPHSANLAHDGALVVQEFRIARAGVICPLSEREGIDPRFGTRHRGAIGITEETDALAIVLSEERGELRVVQGGMVSEALRIPELEQRIAAWLEQPRAEATRSRKASESNEGSRTDMASESMSSLGAAASRSSRRGDASEYSRTDMASESLATLGGSARDPAAGAKEASH